PIAVHIGQCHREHLAVAARADGWCPEGAVAVSCQGHQVVGVVAIDDQIDLAVSIQVSGPNRFRIVSGGKEGGRPEAAIALAQQHSDVRAAAIRHSDVEIAIAVDISKGDTVRVQTNGVNRRSLKRPVPVAKQDGNTITRQAVSEWPVDDDQIHFSVVVEVTGPNCDRLSRNGGRYIVRWLPASIAGVQENAGRREVAVGYRKVWSSVSVQVRGHRGIRSRAIRVRGRLKRSIAVLVEDRGVAGSSVDGRERRDRFTTHLDRRGKV